MQNILTFEWTKSIDLFMKHTNFFETLENYYEKLIIQNVSVTFSFKRCNSTQWFVSPLIHLESSRCTSTLQERLKIRQAQTKAQL